MFNTIWRNIRRYPKEKHIQSGKSQLNLKIVKSVTLLHWEEHCLECVPPECFRSCMNFKARIDQKCIRMAYGFIENPDFSGLFSYGIDCRFEPWAKSSAYLILLDTILVQFVIWIISVAGYHKV